MTSREHMFKGLCEFKGGRKSVTISYHLAKFDGHCSSASGE